MESGETGHGHSTHAMPPQAICNVYKNYQRTDDDTIATDANVVDFDRGLTEEQMAKIVPIDSISSDVISQAQKAFWGHGEATGPVVRIHASSSPLKECTIYEHKDFPGLRILPSLLPPECQVMMLNSMMHRDLSNPLHKTNLQADYEIPYPQHTSSFFAYPPHSKHEVYTPLNPHSNHKPLNTMQFLGKKLRWLTVGEQYNWTTRSYPPESPTPFPPDIGALVTTLFKSAFKPESGVVLLYGTKDFMPVHRDVSEHCQRGLASFTLGCDGLFIISRELEGADLNDENREMMTEVLRVKSGDCIWMGGETRWCWHAMPKIMGKTCPKWLEDWPAGGERKEYEKWKGFMRDRRLNISCRQVWG